MKISIAFRICIVYTNEKVFICKVVRTIRRRISESFDKVINGK